MERGCHVVPSCVSVRLHERHNVRSATTIRVIDDDNDDDDDDDDDD